jgi:peptide/nickel transport system permease protein
VLIGVPLGVISAVKRKTRLDYILRVVSLSGLSMPAFWLGLLVLMFFVSYFGMIPIYTEGRDPGGHPNLLVYGLSGEPAGAIFQA